MDVIVSQEQGRVPVTVFRIVGRVNLGNATELENKAQQAFENGMRDLLIALAEVLSLTSAGLRAFHFIYRLLSSASSEGGGETTQVGAPGKTLRSPHFKFVNPSPPVLKVLTTAGFDMFVEIHTDMQDAIASFG